MSSTAKLSLPPQTEYYTTDTLSLQDNFQMLNDTFNFFSYHDNISDSDKTLLFELRYVRQTNNRLLFLLRSDSVVNFIGIIIDIFVWLLPDALKIVQTRLPEQTH